MAKKKSLKKVVSHASSINRVKLSMLWHSTTCHMEHVKLVVHFFMWSHTLYKSNSKRREVFNLEHKAHHRRRIDVFCFDDEKRIHRSIIIALNKVRATTTTTAVCVWQAIIPVPVIELMTQLRRESSIMIWHLSLPRWIISCFLECILRAHNTHTQMSHNLDSFHLSTIVCSLTWQISAKEKNVYPHAYYQSRWCRTWEAAHFTTCNYDTLIFV